MTSSGQGRPRLGPPPTPARRKDKTTVLHGDRDQESGTAEHITPEIKLFLENAKKFLEDLDNQPLPLSLKKSKDDLYKFFTGGQPIETNDGLDIYDDFNQPDELDKETPIVEEEEYDLVGQEDLNEDQEIKSPDIAGNSSRILSSIADHKAWLWRKESFLKTSRYWALIYNKSLYLYKAAQDEEALQTICLQSGALKKHKNGIKFVLIEQGGGKGGKDAQHQLHAENEEKTSQWIKALERAIAGAGRPGAKKTDRKENQEDTELCRKQSRQSGKTV